MGPLTGDVGIWEGRGPLRPFVHSRLMSWVAFDRPLRLAQQRGLPAPLEAWERTSAEIYEQIMQHGWVRVAAELRAVLRKRGSRRQRLIDGADQICRSYRPAHHRHT